MEQIPDDLFEIIEEDEIMCGTFSHSFDKKMIDEKLFEYGSYRRSHRIITKKTKSLTEYEIIEILTGLSENEQKQYFLDLRIKKLHNEAKDLGYKLVETYDDKSLIL